MSHVVGTSIGNEFGEVAGVDVAKATLMTWFKGSWQELKNNKTEVRRFLKSLPQGTVIAIERTSSYHFLMAAEAVAEGFLVYVLNPLECARYRVALNGRSKTDKIDAEMIARFATKEHDRLRPYVPLPKEIRTLRQLLLRRDKVVKAKVMLEQSLKGDALSTKLAAPAMKKLGELIKALDRQIETLLSQIDGHDEVLSIPGIGPANAACALTALSVGNFPSADSFVAFAGLDCMAKDSGSRVGKRVITRRGDRLLRKLLHLAAMSASGLPAWKPFYERQLAKGLSKIQALTALARKIARTVWSVYTHRASFQDARLYSQKTCLDT